MDQSAYLTLCHGLHLCTLLPLLRKRDVACRDWEPHGGVVKFVTYRNLQQHRAVLSAIARLSCQDRP